MSWGYHLLTTALASVLAVTVGAFASFVGFQMREGYYDREARILAAEGNCDEAWIALAKGSGYSYTIDNYCDTPKELERRLEAVASGWSIEP